MPKRTYLFAISASLFLLVILSLAGRPAVCTDPLGCITVNRQKPLEIGILYAPPGTTCEAALPMIEELEQHAAATAQQENLPLAIVKEESGFDLAAGQQALARLLLHPNLARVLILDCRFGNDPSLRKLIGDAGLSTGSATPLASSSDLIQAFDALIHRVNLQRNSKSDHFLLARTPLKE